MKKPTRQTNKASTAAAKPKEKAVKKTQNKKHQSPENNAPQEQLNERKKQHGKASKNISKNKSKAQMDKSVKKANSLNVQNADNQVALSTLACSSSQYPSKQHPVKRRNKQQNVVQNKEKDISTIAVQSKKIVKNKPNQKGHAYYKKQAKASKNTNKQGHKKTSLSKEVKNANSSDQVPGVMQTQNTGSTQAQTLLNKDNNNQKESSYSNIKSLIGGMGAYFTRIDEAPHAQQNVDQKPAQKRDNINFGEAKGGPQKQKIAYDDSNFNDKQNSIQNQAHEALLKKHQLAQIQQAQQHAAIIAQAREIQQDIQNGSMVAQALQNLLPNLGTQYTDVAQNQMATQSQSMPYMMSAAQPSTELINVAQSHPDLVNEPTFSKLQHLMMYNNVRANQDIQAKLLTALQQKSQQAAGLNLNFSSRYQIIKEAGKGAFGSVYKAEDTQQRGLDPFDTRKYVAIKKLFYDRQYEQRELSTLDEIKKKKLCQNIIELKDRYFQHIEEPEDKKIVSKEYLFIVTDYLPFTVCDLRVQQLPQEHCLESIKQVMKGLFKGLSDLHQLGITHRDIKLSNILIDNNQYPVNLVKICDLGSSKKLISNPNDESTQSLNYIGTRSFRAPELLVGNRYYNTKIDVWSAGIVFLKLILKYINKRVSLFEAKNTNHLCKIIMEYIGEPTKAELNEMLATKDNMSGSIKQGLSDDEIMKKRFRKLDFIIKNQVPEDCIDLLHQVFQLSPKRRISASEALKHPYFCGVGEPDDAKVSVLTKQSMNKNRTTEATSPCTNNNQMYGVGHSTYKQHH